MLPSQIKIIHCRSEHPITNTPTKLILKSTSTEINSTLKKNITIKLQRNNKNN